MRAPMEFLTYSGQDLTGWLVSEKLDGVRGRWDGFHLLTKSGIEIAAPAWFTDRLPGIALEGEIYAGPGTLPRVTGLCMRKSPGDWAGVRFCLFDAPNVDGNYRARIDTGQAALLAAGCRWRFVEQRTCRGRAWLAQRFAQVRARGGEGLVIRDWRAPYEPGRRSARVLKIKESPEVMQLLTERSAYRCAAG